MLDSLLNSGLPVPFYQAAIAGLFSANELTDGIGEYRSPISPTDIAATLDPEVQFFPNLPYVSNPGGPSNLTSLDIYTPPNAQGLPVVIFVHGGAWQIGDKSYVQEKPDAFTDAGYVFVSVNYRLAPEAAFPTYPADVASAIAWVHDNITNYGGDPNTLFAVGHSAGAHLVALVATDEDYLKAAGEDLGILDGVVLLDGAGYNLTNPNLSPNLQSTYREVFGTDSAVLQEASPITHVASGKNIPPFQLFFVPSRDDSRRASRLLADTLTMAGISAQLVPAFGKDHGTLNREIGEPGDRPTAQILDFFESQTSL